MSIITYQTNLLYIKHYSFFFCCFGRYKKMVQYQRNTQEVVIKRLSITTQQNQLVLPLANRKTTTKVRKRKQQNLLRFLQKKKKGWDSRGCNCRVVQVGAQFKKNCGSCIDLGFQKIAAHILFLTGSHFLCHGTGPCAQIINYSFN